MASQILGLKFSFETFSGALGKVQAGGTVRNIDSDPVPELWGNAAGLSFQ